MYKGVCSCVYASVCLLYYCRIAVASRSRTFELAHLPHAICNMQPKIGVDNVLSVLVETEVNCGNNATAVTKITITVTEL